MGRYDVAPTRTNLLAIKGDLLLAHEGHELLEQKRQILLLELKELFARAADAQKRSETELAQAHAALLEAVVAGGMTSVDSAAFAAGTRVELNLHDKRVMGVSVPHVECSIAEGLPYYGIHATSVWLDESRERFRAALEAILDLARTRIAVVRLARAIQKTIRRVNALEKILIPDFEETFRYVLDSLEESDRQALFNLKLIKERLESQDLASDDAKAAALSR